MDYLNILGVYRKLWNNRALDSLQNPETTLREAILRELMDENSHPRVRKPHFEKYYLATKRIIESPLENDEKIILLQLHAELVGSIDIKVDSR